VSYVVLARKYRPRNFAQMAGQEHVVQALMNALGQQRLHHAYLFTGTRGIGKTTVSRILAKSLNCTGADGTGGITAQPCGVCEACTAIDADRYVDYIELDAASNRSIEEVRDLIERAAYKPAVGRFKVFMIDEAHQLTRDAFNALLKTLEEPPEYLKFVLATTDPEKMLPTVLSRCLQFNLRPMAPEVVTQHLARVLAAESVPAEEGALRLLGRAARGSMRDALSLTDQAIAYGGGQLTEEGVAAMLGVAGAGLVLELLRALATRDARQLVVVADALRAAGGSPSSVLEQLAQRLQQLAVAQAVPRDAASVDPEDADFLALAPAFASDELQLLYSLVVHGRAELALVSDDHAGLLMVLLRYLAFSAPVPAGASGSTTSVMPQASAGIPPPEPARAPREAPLRVPAPPASSVVLPVPAPAPPSVSVPEPSLPVDARAPAAMARATHIDDPALASRWDETVRKLAAAGALSGLTRELAWQSSLTALEPGPPVRWRLAVAHDSLRGAAVVERLAEALRTASGGELSLQVDIGDPQDTPARRDAAERSRRQAQADEAIREDPFVQELLQQFGTARVVPGSVKPL
jgi:DNA polymerase-3 subunit gamma/tau